MPGKIDLPINDLKLGWIPITRYTYDNQGFRRGRRGQVRTWVRTCPIKAKEVSAVFGPLSVGCRGAGT
jgi:hypothetical protein